MTERPILFSGEMVRAILEGRKTQTRRVIKPQPVDVGGGMVKWDGRGIVTDTGIQYEFEPHLMLPYCPYGVPGCELWVRETWGIAKIGSLRLEELPTFEYQDLPKGLSQDEQFSLAMDGKYVIEDGYEIIYRADGTNHTGKWRPSIFMPRWASRIQLRIVSVRVERLQDISEADAQAEGVSRPPCFSLEPDYRAWFKHLWDKINGKRAPWDSNPWVWAVEFESKYAEVEG